MIKKLSQKWVRKLPYIIPEFFQYSSQRILGAVSKGLNVLIRAKKRIITIRVIVEINLCPMMIDINLEPRRSRELGFMRVF